MALPTICSRRNPVVDALASALDRGKSCTIDHLSDAPVLAEDPDLGECILEPCGSNEVRLSPEPDQQLARATPLDNPRDRTGKVGTSEDGKGVRVRAWAQLKDTLPFQKDTGRPALLDSRLEGGLSTWGKPVVGATFWLRVIGVKKTLGKHLANGSLNIAGSPAYRLRRLVESPAPTVERLGDLESGASKLSAGHSRGLCTKRWLLATKSDRKPSPL